MLKACTDKCESRSEPIPALKQNRSAFCQTQPFIFQGTIARVDCIASGNEHNPEAVPQFVPVLADNFSQPTPNTVANNCAANRTRSNKTYAARPGVLYQRDICNQKFAASRKALSFHASIL